LQRFVLTQLVPLLVLERESMRSARAERIQGVCTSSMASGVGLAWL
jgi:hypothetical protein